MKMRVCVLYVCNMILNAAVAVSTVSEVTLQPEHCVALYSRWLVKANIDQLTVLHFPANLTLECDIWITPVSMFQNKRDQPLKITPSPSTPCGYGKLTSSLNKIEFEPMDLCLVNNVTRLYTYVTVKLGGDMESIPEFSLVITPTWLCGGNDTNVSCCDAEYTSRLTNSAKAKPEYAKKFAMLCDGRYCMEEAYICDGVASCADGKDEGEVCDVTTLTSDGRGRVDGMAEWLLASTAAFCILYSMTMG